MRRTVKRVSSFAMALWLSMSAGMTALAGEWQQNDRGWWYRNTDGTWPAGTWEWLDGNSDGVAECYYFDAEGYMLSDAVTPDGYQVDSNGRWIENGVVKTEGVFGEETSEDETQEDEFESKAVEKAKERLYDAEGETFSKRKRAALNYLEALGYDASGLTITTSQIRYPGGFMFGSDSLYNLLEYNSQNVFDSLAAYVFGSGDADTFIEAVEDYLYR